MKTNLLGWLAGLILLFSIISPWITVGRINTHLWGYSLNGDFHFGNVQPLFSISLLSITLALILVFLGSRLGLLVGGFLSTIALLASTLEILPYPGLGFYLGFVGTLVYLISLSYSSFSSKKAEIHMDSKINLKVLPLFMLAFAVFAIVSAYIVEDQGYNYVIVPIVYLPWTILPLTMFVGQYGIIGASLGSPIGHLIYFFSARGLVGPYELLSFLTYWIFPQFVVIFFGCRIAYSSVQKMDFHQRFFLGSLIITLFMIIGNFVSFALYFENPWIYDPQIARLFYIALSDSTFVFIAFFYLPIIWTLMFGYLILEVIIALKFPPRKQAIEPQNMYALRARSGTE